MAWLAMLTGMLLASFSWADTGEGASESELPAKDVANPQKAARKSYSLGKQAYQKKDYSAAEQYFRRAYELKPHPSALKMVAECRLGAKDIAAAVQILESLPADENGAKKDQIRKRIESLRKLVGKVRIETIPPGAMVVVNGKPMETPAPLETVVNPGDVKVEARLEDRESIEEITIVAGAEETLTIELPPKPEEPVAEVPPLASVPEPVANPTVDAPSLKKKPESAPHAVAPSQLGAKSEELPRAFWAATAVAGIGLVSGTVFGTMALRDEKDFEASADQAILDSGKRAAVIADISFGLALGAAVAGTVVLISEKRKRNKKKRAGRSRVSDVSVLPAVGSTGAGVATGLSF
ncbi:MAG: tetratricopeptide repeat protein [Deltaproteobacteria bacterium]|nr:tetratricopeptide repeat protein [Deltaproteobacteria bacterium]